MSNTLLNVSQLSYTISNTLLFKEVTFSLHEHEITSIIGYNGSGKSTLIKLLLGTLQPTTGTIQRKEGLRIGYVPQKLSFTQGIPLTVKDFIHIYTTKNNQESRNIPCELLDITPLRDSPLYGLSGGQLQKVLLYNALLGNPHILFLDEPTSGLDIIAQREFYELIDHLYTKHSMSIVLISHDIHSVYKKSDQVICLHNGICCTGSPDDTEFSDEVTSIFGTYMTPYVHHHTTSSRNIT